MTEYDPKVIQKSADRLYSRAASIVLGYTVLNGLIGAAVGYAAAFYLNPGDSMLYPFVGLVLLGALGYVIGSERAFLLRLQAQTSLCQVKIEQNTRALSNSVTAQPEQIPATGESPVERAVRS